VTEFDQTETSTRRRGRPEKNGRKDLRDLARGLKILHAYTMAREKHLKHSAAVRETVEFIRRLDPGTRTSETAVKRVLAEFLPQDSQVMVKVHLSVLEGDEAARKRRRLVQMLQSAGDSRANRLTCQNLQKPSKTFKFGFERRTAYQRHNAKCPKPQD
jgi:hypothetical protein